jgi:hypothetical protein
LTDGEDASNNDGETIVRVVSEELNASPDYRANIFTYSLGAGAEEVVPKKIACTNDGIWYKIDRAEDLPDRMADFYRYYVRSTAENVVRWIEYDDIVTGGVLIAACLPVFPPGGESWELYGVACLDINMIISVDMLKGKDDYSDFVARVERDNGYCSPISLSAEEMQSIRRHLGESAVCTSCELDADCAVGSDFEGGAYTLSALALLFFPHFA